MPRSRRLLKERCYFIKLLAGIEQFKQFSDFWIDLVQLKTRNTLRGVLRPIAIRCERKKTISPQSCEMSAASLCACSTMINQDHVAKLIEAGLVETREVIEHWVGGAKGPGEHRGFFDARPCLEKDAQHGNCRRGSPGFRNRTPCLCLSNPQNVSNSKGMDVHPRFRFGARVCTYNAALPLPRFLLSPRCSWRAPRWRKARSQRQ
jgi:hypothetical protein